MPAAGRSQQLAKEPHRRQTVALGLHQNINDHTVLIDGPPEIMPRAIDVEEDLVQMPLVSSPRPSFPQPGRELVPELFAPSTDRFVADHHAAGRHGFFDVPETHREPIVEPNGIRDDLFREAIAAVWVVGHSFSISSPNDHQCDNAVAGACGHVGTMVRNLPAGRVSGGTTGSRVGRPDAGCQTQRR